MLSNVVFDALKSNFWRFTTRSKHQVLKLKDRYIYS